MKTKQEVKKTRNQYSAEFKKHALARAEKDGILKGQRFAESEGYDLPEITDWQWPAAVLSRPSPRIHPLPALRDLPRRGLPCKVRK